jgi:deazaflavin-dependent oxidoreductase (nitroreductase family)
VGSRNVRGMPSIMTLRAMNGIHRFLLKITGGRVGWRVLGMPVLELTTTGQTSGQQRAVMLTSPVQEPNAIVIVASRGGADQHPAWFLNLRNSPYVDVAFAGKPIQPMRARVAPRRNEPRCGLASSPHTRVTPTIKHAPTLRSRSCCSNPPTAPASDPRLITFSLPR